jgi:hypothetical protein
LSDGGLEMRAAQRAHSGDRLGHRRSERLSEMRLETIAHSRLDARTTPNTAKMTRMKLMASMVCERGGGGCGEG